MGSNITARRMPRQPPRKERLNNQKKNRQANRLGSCRLLAKTGESPTSFEWACRCFSKTNACRLVIDRQEIAISRKKCVIVGTPTPHHAAARKSTGSRSRTAAIQRWIEFWSRSDDSPFSTSLDCPRNRIGVLHLAGDGSNLRPKLSRLHRDIFDWRRLHQLQLHLNAPMQSDGLGPRGAML